VKLSAQQAKILEMLCSGWRPKEIADVLTLSPRTVSEYIVRAIRKLRAQTRDEACSIFTKQRLTSEPVRQKADGKRRTR
jgi:DNA-binding NarL/FixJ family response regulator